MKIDRPLVWINIPVFIQDYEAYVESCESLSDLVGSLEYGAKLTAERRKAETVRKELKTTQMVDDLLNFVGNFAAGSDVDKWNLLMKNGGFRNTKRREGIA